MTLVVCARRRVGGEQRGQDQEGGKAAKQGHGRDLLIQAGRPGVLACMQWAPLSRMLGRHERSLSYRSRPTATEVTPAPAAGAIGVLLVNLGTPDAADAPAVRRYLKEFLSDPRVIENQGVVWQVVLNGIILPIRPRIKAKDYQKIWNIERNESPLKTITRAQAEKLAAALEPLGRAHRGRLGDALRQSVDRVAACEPRCPRLRAHPVMPLYPQYSAATTATVCDEVFRVLMGLRRQPTRARRRALLRRQGLYRGAGVLDARTSSASSRSQPEIILASYHGMPEEYVRKGDPYERHCIETTRLLREALGIDESKLMLTFQSRFGRAKWLEPATDQTVKALAKRGVKSLAVVTPGFSADCLETLEEIAVENAHIFRKAGGENFAAIPCLNDSAPGMLLLEELARRELKGWVMDGLTVRDGVRALGETHHGATNCDGFRCAQPSYRLGRELRVRRNRERKGRMSC